MLAAASDAVVHRARVVVDAVLLAGARTTRVGAAVRAPARIRGSGVAFLLVLLAGADRAFAQPGDGRVAFARRRAVGKRRVDG